MSDQQKGMKRGLTRYGDEAFSLYLRKAFIKARATAMMRWRVR